MAAYQPFLPWVGPRYASDGLGGVRLLLLGESHYGGEGDSHPEFTRAVIRDWALPGRDRYFGRVARLVLGLAPGAPLTDVARQSFWESIAFYNYVPGLVGATPRVRPSAEQWSAGIAPLRNVLADLRPQSMLVLGRELWDHVVGLEPHATDPALRQMPLPNGGSALAAAVRHPSAPGFRYAVWRPLVERLLEPSHATRTSAHQRAGV